MGSTAFRRSGFIEGAIVFFRPHSEPPFTLEVFPILLGLNLDLSNLGRFGILDGHGTVMQEGEIDTVCADTGFVHSHVIVPVFEKSYLEILIKRSYFFPDRAPDQEAGEIGMRTIIPTSG